MNDRLKYLAIFLFALIVLRVEALGLGELVIRSKLGQVLDAKIGLIEKSPLSPEEIRANIAGQLEDNKYDIDGSYARQNIKVDVIEEEQGLSLKLTSNLPIKEPIINFLLDISWNTGRLIKEHVLLLDPPNYEMTVAHKESATERPSQDPTHEVVSFPSHQVKEGHYGPVQYGETLFRIALNTRPVGHGIGLDDMMAAIMAYNPKAFLNNQPEGLMQDSILYIPTVDEILAGDFEAIVSTEKETVAEETIVEEQTENLTTEIKQTAEELLRSLERLAQHLTSLQFTTRLGTLGETTTITDTPVEPSHLTLTTSLSQESQDYIQQLIPEEIIEPVVDEIVLEEVPEEEIVAEEAIIEDETVEAETIAEEVVEETAIVEEVITEALPPIEEISTEESFEPEVIDEEEITEPVLADSTIDETQIEEQTTHASSSVSFLDEIITKLSPYLIPLSAIAILLMALILWFFGKRARKDASENVLYDSLERASSDKTVDSTPTEIESDVDETVMEDKTETKTEMTEEEEEVFDFVDTNEIPFEELKAEEAVDTATEQDAPASLDFDSAKEVDIPLAMDDTFSEDDMVIDEDDYEDLLDITSDGSDKQAKEEAAPEIEMAKDEPLTLDMDLYSGEISSNGNGSEVDTEEQAFIKEVNVHIAYGDFDGAKDKIEQALASEPENPRYKLAMLNLLKTSGQTNAAMELASELKKIEDLSDDIKKEVESISQELHGGKQTGFA